MTVQTIFLLHFYKYLTICWKFNTRTISLQESILTLFAIRYCLIRIHWSFLKHYGFSFCCLVTSVLSSYWSVQILKASFTQFCKAFRRYVVVIKVHQCRIFKTRRYLLASFMQQQCATNTQGD